MKMIATVLGLALLFSTGCVPSPQSGRGFTLPNGDVQLGQETYVALQCNACHKIEGVPQLVAEDEEPGLSIALGGKVARIQTYGELVTSIINPSHRLSSKYTSEEVAIDGESKMRNYNDVMTVSQLTNLVAFLQSKYELLEYESTDYPYYY